MPNTTSRSEALVEPTLGEAIQPILADYDDARRRFSWEAARSELTGLPDGRGLNIAFEAVDRHVVGSRADRVALRWLPKRGHPVDLTYRDLAARTNRFASTLAGLGAGPGTRVASLAGRVPGLYVAALGTWKAGGVFCPLFSAFGPDPVKQRLNLGGIEVLVTTAALYERRVAPNRAQVPSLRHVLLLDGGSDRFGDPSVMDLEPLLEASSADFDIVATAADDVAILHFTSGTTGTPKGALHVHGAVVAHHATGGIVLDLHPDDVFWCTADPGWVTGTSYGIISPLTRGVTSIVDEAEFDADRWYGIVQDQHVTIWYTAPTAIRMMMRVGLEAVHEYDLSSLRLVASVGEPLNPEAVRWGQRAFGRPILDNWWQTETGGIMIANFRSAPVKPGSMGRPLPGIDATLLERDDEGELVLDAHGRPVEVTEPDRTGELALRAGWPSMFRGYLDMEDRYRRCFVDGWYRSGDLARRDTDGYYTFVGRGDDVIKSAGHLIGPFEVESVLMEHEAVAEAGVIGKPDEVAGNVIKAFVSLVPGRRGDDDLRRDLVAFARRRLGPAAAPREIEFTDDLPHTRSGKIMRRLLRARELGLPEGDLSTLEAPR